MTNLAVPVAAINLSEAEEQIKAATAASAEMLELRTDYLAHLSVDLALQVINAARRFAPSLPIIVTCRDYHQGGSLRHPNQLRTDVLTAAVRAGAEFVDVEYQNFISEAINSKIALTFSAGAGTRTRLILSAHNFQTKFKEIRKLYNDILSVRPGAIPKLVYSAHHINDCFDILDLLHDRKDEMIAFCMDEPGFITRVLAKKLGGFITFASIDEKTATAPGQPTVAQLRDIYRWDSINAQTELYGVIGSPIAHSLSPAIHNACFADAGFNKAYLPLLVAGGQEDFNTFMDNILARPWLDFRGFSVTIPHKENALNYVKSKGGFIEPLAAKIGAANTIVIEAGRKTQDAGRLSAFNTDCAAALDSITSALHIDLAGLKQMSVAVIGAGGAARAVVAGLAEAEAKVKIYNRTVERAKHLAADFKCDYASLNDLHKLKEKLIVNCTSIGMYPNIDASPVDVELLQKHMTVFDTVYNPPETLLLKHAGETGCKTISGVDMFVSQAEEQFRLFTGQSANVGTMRKILSLK
ncbi:MAG: shikimate dehydrogenase [Sedimentisphaerales bacterium]|jgi:3-dehydroquinate dehydratase/shikimate dehydrogenase